MHCEGTLLQMLSDWPLVSNLMKVMSLYCFTQVSFHISSFLLKYVPGSFYMNQACYFLAHIAACFVTAILSTTMDSRKIISYFYVVLTFGALSLLIYGTDSSTNVELATASSVFLVAMGSYGAISTLYLAHSDLFPAVFRTTTVGFC